MNKLRLSDVGSMSEPLEPSAVDSVYGDKSENEKRDLILVFTSVAYVFINCLKN